MKFEDLRHGTVERFVADEDGAPDFPHLEELDDAAVDNMIESGRQEYYEAWWDYVSEFN